MALIDLTKFRQQQPTPEVMAPIVPDASMSGPAPMMQVTGPQVTLDPNRAHQIAAMPNMLDRIEAKQGDRLMSDYQKDANPYGSANNHPGFLGRFLHGLNVATGGTNRRLWEEQGLEKNLGDLEKQKSSQGLQGAEASHLNAETPEIAPNSAATRNVQGAQARHLNDESDDLENPRPTFSVHDTSVGPLFINNQTGTGQHLTVDGKPVGPPIKLTQSQPIVGPDGKAHTYMLDEQGNKVVDLGEHYERPNQIRIETPHEQFGEKQGLLKLYAPAQDSAERFNVMAKNYEDAVRNHDQQAMLSLLANHLGMTMGLQKGSRLTRDIIREAQQSRPWLQGIKASFDKDGYLTGVNLTPEQMRQMVSLGSERFAEDMKKARSQAKYMGATDDGPERTPNASTMAYYLNLAGKDPEKAMQMMQQDGWSVTK